MSDGATRLTAIAVLMSADEAAHAAAVAVIG